MPLVHCKQAEDVQQNKVNSELLFPGAAGETPAATSESAAGDGAKEHRPWQCQSFWRFIVERGNDKAPRLFLWRDLFPEGTRLLYAEHYNKCRPLLLTDERQGVYEQSSAGLHQSSNAFKGTENNYFHRVDGGLWGI
ncbi:hypothetical protein NDU88_001250 [Pleurodeles waltl]|uniref:Uncharacterized protein n=1 Tax=Pleurodeles waltl TaxID=8319 RepID=A0AAV7U5U6_PLEWA|nr:hypothetical protein NDU88_001250 [Pleurodeles waltl]